MTTTAPPLVMVTITITIPILPGSFLPQIALDDVTVADTVASLKRAIAAKMDVPPERQTLIVNGRPLVDDAAALVDYLSSSSAAATEEITVLVLVK